MTAIILFVAMLLLFAVNVPVPLAVGLAAIAAMLVAGGMDLQVVVQRMFYGLNNYIFLAIPLFILLGQLMMSAKITERLVDFALVLVGHVKGGLAHVSVVASAVMSSISGSSVADAAATGAVLGPSMVKTGYPNGFAAAVIATASAGAALIPPSITMIIYASLANVSVARIFVAGIVPAILIALVLMLGIAREARRLNLPAASERPSMAVVGKATSRALLVLAAPLIVIVGVVGGVFTPTESAGVAVAYALFLATVVYRSINLKGLVSVLADTLRISAQLMLTIATASVFSWILSRAGVPQQIAELSIFQGENSWFFIPLTINVIVFLLGLVMDGTAILVIVTPIFLPLAIAAGIDPVHLGIILAINLAIGGISPPFGVLMFVLCSVTPATLLQYTRALVPFLVLLVVLILVITYVPPLSLALPDLWLGNRG